MTSQERVVIVGGGFGGLAAARALRRTSVQVVLVDRSNHHLFQPLLYQVATAGLSPSEIGVPIRAILTRQRNVTVVMTEVEKVRLADRHLECRGGERLDYDYLVLAPGSTNSYFGHDEWAEHTLPLKDLDDAIEIRRRVLLSVEAADREADPDRRRAQLTFVVIGGGPTGVEVAGALAELSRVVLARDYRRVGPESPRVVLLEAGPRILGPFGEKLADRGRSQLESLGVEVQTDTAVTGIDADGVSFEDGRIEADTVIWAAGVAASPLGKTLGVDLGPGGRVPIGKDCSLDGHPEVFVIGDLAHFVTEGGSPLPGLAPVAIQQGRHAAKAITATLRGRPRFEFRYRDKGTMATIGRSRAVAQAMGLEVSGLPAWLAWLFVHLIYLIGFRNRLLVLFDWFWAYVTYRRGARLITGRKLPEVKAPTIPE